MYSRYNEDNEGVYHSDNYNDDTQAEEKDKHDMQARWNSGGTQENMSNHYRSMPSLILFDYREGVPFVRIQDPLSRE